MEDTVCGRIQRYHQTARHVCMQSTNEHCLNHRSYSLVRHQEKLMATFDKNPHRGLDLAHPCIYLWCYDISSSQLLRRLRDSGCRGIVFFFLFFFLVMWTDYLAEFFHIFEKNFVYMHRCQCSIQHLLKRVEKSRTHAGSSMSVWWKERKRWRKKLFHFVIYCIAQLGIVIEWKIVSTFWMPVNMFIFWFRYMGFGRSKSSPCRKSKTTTPSSEFIIFMWVRYDEVISVSFLSFATWKFPSYIMPIAHNRHIHLVDLFDWNTITHLQRVYNKIINTFK